MPKAKAAPFKEGNRAGRRKTSSSSSSHQPPAVQVSKPRRRLNKINRSAAKRKEKNANLREKARLKKIAQSQQTDNPLPCDWHPRKYGKSGDGPSSYTNNEVAELLYNLEQAKQAQAKAQQALADKESDIKELINQRNQLWDHGANKDIMEPRPAWTETIVFPPQ